MGPSIEALETFFSERTGASTRFPDDAEFRQGLLSKPAFTFAAHTRIKDVFWELENASRSKFAEKTEMPGSAWSEHVLPVSWTGGGHSKRVSSWSGGLLTQGQRKEIRSFTLWETSLF